MDVDYHSGDEFVVEFLDYRYGFSRTDFTQRVVAAAIRLELLPQRDLSDDEVSYTRIIDPAPSGDELPLPPRGERPALVWRPRLGEDTSYELAGRVTKLGRHDENDIVLAGPTVSARHATVRIEPIGVVLEDEGSLNGTFVNGERIEQRLLEDGDRIQVGPHLLVFVPAVD